MAGSLLVVLAITSFALRRTSNVYLIDHLNINHEQGRHDLLTAFYVERLVLAAGDTRADGAPRQTLTFASGARESMSHAELGSDENGKPVNNGAHFSLYLADLREAYAKAEALGVCYVNHHFKRRALTRTVLSSPNSSRSMKLRMQCMFRILTVVDPEVTLAPPAPLL